MSEYQVTRDECQAGIDKAAGVCPGCGGQVTPIETVDNSDHPTFWAGCEACSVFTCPVSQQAYRAASVLIDRDREYCYKPKPYQASDDEVAYWRSCEMREMCRRVMRYHNVYEEATHD